VDEVYGKLGIEWELKKLPGKRALADADSGKYDGALCRTAIVEKQCKNLVRIPVSIGTVQVGVFTIDKQFEVNGWASLKPYKLGVIRGLALTDKPTENMDRNMINGPKSAFDMMIKGRHDVVVVPRLDALVYLKKNNLEDKIKAYSKPVMELKLFHYLHEKHEELIPKFTKVLQEMEEKGKLKELIAKSEKKAIDLFVGNTE